MASALSLMEIGDLRLYSCVKRGNKNYNARKLSTRYSKF